MNVLDCRVRACLVVTIAVATMAACSADPQVAKQEYFARGQAYIAQKKYHEAIIELRNAVQIDARFGEARYQLADAYAQVGDTDNAFREYVRAADLLPDTKVQLKAGVLLLLSGRLEDAKARAEKVLASDPANIEAYILLGNAMARLKDFGAAVEQMHRAIEADPNTGLAYASLGTFELQRGNRPDAEAAFAKAIELDPTSAPARVALGNYRLAVGERGQAEVAFLEALELDPHSVLALRSTIALYLTSGQLDRVEPYLLKLIAETEDAQSSILLADVYTALKQTDRARAVLEPLASQKDGSLMAKLRLASLDFVAGRRVEALAAVDAVLMQQPNEPQALVLKGRILASDQKFDEALAQFQSAAEADPKDDVARYWLAVVLASRGRTDDARKALNEAVQANPQALGAYVLLSQLQLRGGDRGAALAAARQAVQNAPRSADARVALVWALIGTGDLSRAEEELKALSSAKADPSAVLVLQGTLDLVRKNPENAERAFAKALEVQPKSYAALAGLIQTRVAAGNLAGAQTQAEAALQASPEDPRTLLIAARTYASARAFDRAEEMARRAIAADPHLLAAYGLLGQLYIVQRRTEDAIKEFDELAQRGSNPVTANTVVGILLQGSNRRAEAKTRYEKVLTIDPSAAVAANNLAWMQVEDKENLDVALQLAQTAKRRLPDSPEVSDTLGYIYYLKGLYPSAIDAFKVGVEKEPANPFYQYRLGMAYAKSGNTALARERLARALKLGSSFPGADEARETLASIH